MSTLKQLIKNDIILKKKQRSAVFNYYKKKRPDVKYPFLATYLWVTFTYTEKYDKAVSDSMSTWLTAINDHVKDTMVDAGIPGDVLEFTGDAEYAHNNKHRIEPMFDTRRNIIGYALCNPDHN